MSRGRLGTCPVHVSQSFRRKLLGTGSIAGSLRVADLNLGSVSIEPEELRAPSLVRLGLLRDPLMRRYLVGQKGTDLFGDSGLLV